MAQTLTEARRVAWEIQGVGPDPARCLVIFRRVGGGKVLQEVLKPGQIFKRRFLQSAHSYLAYAVSTDRYLRHDFTRKYQHSGQTRSFILKFDLEFRVTDARRLALAMEDGDPVKLLEEEIGRVLGVSARRLGWQVLKEESEDFGARLLEAETPDSQGEQKGNCDRLNDFSENMGLGLQRIDVTRTLTEDALRPDIAIVNAADQLAVDQVEHDLAREREKMKQQHEWLAAQGRNALRGLERLQTFLDEINTQSSRALSQATDGVRSFAAIHNALREIQAIHASFSMLSTGSHPTLGGGSGAPALGTGTPVALLPPSTLAADPLERVVLRAFEGLRDFAGDPADRRRLLGLVLHLVAEVGLGSDADSEFVEAYRGQLVELFKLLAAGMEQEEVEILRGIMDIESLRRDLSPEAPHGGA
jgi:hypothetical protein